MNRIFLVIVVTALMAADIRGSSRPIPARIIATKTNSLELGFRTPPNEARPQVWWHWVNGHISKETITRDLEAMKQIGLGGFTLFNTAEGIPPGPVKYMSDQWWDLINYAIAESERLGLEMGVHNGAGWSSSGGPWVTPDKAMQEVAWTEKQLKGPAVFDGTLETPIPALGIERDMARNPEINKRYYVQRTQVEGYFHDIALLAFPTPKNDQCGAPFRLENWKAKAGFSKLESYTQDQRIATNDDKIEISKIIDLTSKLDHSGHLRWNVPEGEWTLLRIGYQPTARQNHPAPLEGRGLEIDKFSSDAVDFYWKNAIEKMIELSQKDHAKPLKHILIDSYEVGHQNWNVTFGKAFQDNRGYNPLFYLPTLTGRVVGDIETSEKFLWDFRKTINDLIVKNYYGRFADLCKKNGLTFSAEPYGNYGNTNDFDVAGTVYTPMNEWWAFRSNSEHAAQAKLVSSAGHTYGRQIIGAEAFTGDPTRIFEECPRNLKSQGDYFFCRGINQFSLHAFAHDPYEKIPGLGLGTYGCRFDRRNTWWSYAKEWINYLARCQFLLQQGKSKADVLYYVGEDAPLVAVPKEKLNPSLTPGYDYDFCNTDILKHLEVRDGILILPNGQEYRILVLPHGKYMRPFVLEKIEQLVADGATIIGPKPLSVPGLGGGTGAESHLKKIAQCLWGNCDGETVTLHKYGKGKVYWGKSIDAVCKEIGLLPDFSFRELGNERLEETQDKEAGIEFIHRQSDDTNFYFISNQHEKSRIVEATFRINSMLPELWNPETGTIDEASEFRMTSDGRMVVTLRLEENGSVFVVFRKPLKKEIGIASVEKDGVPVDVHLSKIKNRFFLQSREAGIFSVKFGDGESHRLEIPFVPEQVVFTRPWEVSFPSGWGAPEKIQLPKLISWSEHNDSGVKYFSGTAIYKTQIDISPDILSKNYKNILDLGDVQVIAEVSVNGKLQGVLWKKPYSVDITNSLSPGINKIEVCVTNLWVNRLIGDQQYPDDCEWTTETGSTAKGFGLKKIPEWVVNNTPRPSLQRKAFVAWKWPHLEKKELLPSGLLGPVRIITEVKEAIK
ncbi:MAG: glycosyl hydrolase [Mangrovibacterium sp.]